MNKQILQKENYDDMIFNVTIKALEQEIDEDIISRKVVKAEYKRKLESNLKDEERGIDLTEFADCTEFNKFIDSIPPVTPQPKTGHWIYDDECHEHGHCSECGYGRVDLVNGEPHNFCRRCGAKMIEPQERSDKE